MEGNINSISLVFNSTDTDFSLTKEEIKSFNLLKQNSTNEYNNLFTHIKMIFELRDTYDESSIQSLLFHDYSIKEIVVDYENKPSMVYSRHSILDEELFISDYVIQVNNSNKNNIKVTLDIDALLKRRVLQVKKQDVQVYSEEERLKHNYRTVRNAETAGLLLVNGRATYKKINLQGLNPLAVIGSKRIELNKTETGWKIINEDDQKYIDNYFYEREIDYEKVLNRITFKIVDDIKTRAAVRGYTLACIHKYKYRINEEYNMFNVLVEWSYGMLNPPKRINVVN